MKRLMVLLVALLTALMMSMPVAMAHHDVGHLNSGNKANDGLDANNGGDRRRQRIPALPTVVEISTGVVASRPN